jgi:hypothetical protein
MLASTLIEHLRQVCKNNSTSSMAYFFFIYNLQDLALRL